MIFGHSLYFWFWPVYFQEYFHGVGAVIGNWVSWIWTCSEEEITSNAGWMGFAMGPEVYMRLLQDGFWLGVDVFLPKVYFLFSLTPLCKTVIIFLALTRNKCNYCLVSSWMLTLILHFHSQIFLSLTFLLARGPYFWYCIFCYLCFLYDCHQRMLVKCTCYP